MIAIITRYRGPTDTRGSRVVASCPMQGERRTRGWDHGLGQHGNHEAAADALADHLGLDSRQGVHAPVRPGEWAHLYRQAWEVTP